jgi:hypothetical protein
LIITDREAGNGWDLADQAKQIRPGLPVLLTSGHALETLVQQGRLQTGAMALSGAFSSEVETGSRKENASKQKAGVRF